MRTTRRLHNGETLSLEVPTAAGLPPSATISVLSHDGQELEINSGSTHHLEHYLSTTGSTLTDQVQLRAGLTLRHGRFGGDPASGLAFAVAVGGHEVYGFTTPSLDLEGLTALLAQVQIQAGETGPVLTPGGSVTWSPFRTHDVAQVVELTSGGHALLDIRRTRSGVTRPSGGGLKVSGGRLSRSAPDDRAQYAVLETASFVVYGIPGTVADLDTVASTLGQVRAELA